MHFTETCVSRFGALNLFHSFWRFASNCQRLEVGLDLCHLDLPEKREPLFVEWNANDSHIIANRRLHC